MKIDLLIIDPQMDFMDFPGNPGALAVPGAHEDMRRLAKLVDRFGGSLNDIHVTLDSHHALDIAHPTWWTDSKGASPAPFTPISVDDVASGKWRARIAEFASRSADYVKTLADEGRYGLLVWPEHCLIGSAGHAIHPELFEALGGWERKNLAVVDMVTKGSNPFTEHYSGLKAEVPDPEDATTQLNMGLIQTLERADMVLIAGEALSHCVANTVRDIVASFDPSAISKLALLRDCCSSVPGFEKLGLDFVEEMRALGVKIVDSGDFVAPRRGSKP
jgi:nicotinamidase/pyrazinamidase